MDLENGRDREPATEAHPCPEAEPSPQPTPSSKAAAATTWLGNLREDVSASYSDLPILACCAVSGLCDSVAFNAGGVFVSMVW